MGKILKLSLLILLTLGLQACPPKPSDDATESTSPKETEKSYETRVQTERLTNLARVFSDLQTLRDIVDLNANRPQVNIKKGCVDYQIRRDIRFLKVIYNCHQVQVIAGKRVREDLYGTQSFIDQRASKRVKVTINSERYYTDLGAPNETPKHFHYDSEIYLDTVGLNFASQKVTFTATGNLFDVNDQNQPPLENIKFSNSGVFFGQKSTGAGFPFIFTLTDSQFNLKFENNVPSNSSPKSQGVLQVYSKAAVTFKGKCKMPVGQFYWSLKEDINGSAIATEGMVTADETGIKDLSSASSNWVCVNSEEGE